MRIAILLMLAAAALAQQEGQTGSGREDITRDLWDAASAGDTARVRLDLEAGAQVDATGKNGRTALMLAAQHNHPETVKALLAAGANPAARDSSGFTAYSVTLFEPAGHGSHDAVLKLLPQPPRLRLSVITGWTTQNLVSSCFQQRTQIMQQIGLMKPDEMMLRELQSYIKSQGKGLAQMVAIDAKGIDPLKATPTDSADGIVLLQVEPGAACAGGAGDNLSLTMAMQVFRARDAKLLLEKRFGGGVKGLRTLKVDNPAQYKPVYETWLKEQPSVVYWEAVEILMRWQ